MVVVVVGRLVVGLAEGALEMLQEILETTCIAVCSGSTCTLWFIPLKGLAHRGGDVVVESVSKLAS